jgi:uncharacterized RDD family membrane protein YckC
MRKAVIRFEKNMIENNFKKYSYKTLCEIRDNIDRKKNPDEYSKIVEIIYQRQKEKDFQSEEPSLNISELSIKTKPYLSKRITAFFIDYLIIFCFILLMLNFYGTSSSDGGESLKGLPALLVFCFWILMTIGIEQMLGATLGNYAMDLKPVSIDKLKPLTVSQSIKRHLLAPIDFWFFGLIAFILIKNTKYNQRLGDIWAKTIVINTSNKN